jgi:hypothetical protein
MLYGKVISYGHMAVAIQTNAGVQYYAPLEDCDEEIFDFLCADVMFDVDVTRFEGSTYAGKRMYAYNVKLIKI